jgi:hypothetical protein
MMNPIRGALRVVTNTANAATAAAGAVGGAAVNGVIGGVQGTAQGVRSGLAKGSHSTPAAALTIAALGATGLVDWPVLLTVGGAAIVIRQLTHHPNGQSPAARPSLSAVGSSTPTRTTARKSTPAKKAPAKRTAARKAPSRRASSRQR